jgi:hypothetical protein
VGRAADQFAEKQDVFGVEIAVGQVEDNLRRFIGVVKLSGGGGVIGLRFRDRLFRSGGGLF